MTAGPIITVFIHAHVKKGHPPSFVFLEAIGEFVQKFPDRRFVVFEFWDEEETDRHSLNIRLTSDAESFIIVIIFKCK